MPGTVEVTLTRTAQVAPAAIVALFSVIDASPLARGFPEKPLSDAEPPQAVRVIPGGFAITIFAGRLSVSDVCVREALVSVFLILMVRVLACPTQMVLGANDLLREGGWTLFICSVALAGVVLVTGTVPVGSVECNVLAGIVLTWFPAIVDVTFTVTVQEPGVIPTWAGTVPPMRERVVPTIVTTPPQVFVVFGGTATFKFAEERSSVHAAGFVDNVRANEFGL